MGLKLAVFGTFYPEHNYAGNSTTPIAIGLSKSDLVDLVHVFCQRGARVPEGVSGGKLDLVRMWRHDRPISILRAGLALARHARNLDSIIFNTYVTAYGRSRFANVIGLLLPSIVARLSRRPVLVYMHNFVETQDVRKLGYFPSHAALWLVRLLELSLLRNSQVIVPLTTQAGAVRSSLGYAPTTLFLPHIESYLARLRRRSQPEGRIVSHENAKRVLLLGTWGPQKDLQGVLSSLDRLALGFPSLQVTLAGSENKHFPGYLPTLPVGDLEALQGRIRWTGELSDDDLFELITEQDLLLLPYRTSGGYSGALNFAAGTGIRVLAYDHPQLREQARLLGTEVRFVAPDQLELALQDELSQIGLKPLEHRDSEDEVVQRIESGIRQLEVLALQAKGGLGHGTERLTRVT